jgi:predicted ATPase
MEKIRIENFGPLIKVEVIINDINIFIGTTSSGKSTVAKLISVFQNPLFRNSISPEHFNELLADYNIDFKIETNTYIRYDNQELFVEIKGKDIKSNFTSKKPDLINPIYIPAERVFFSTISQSIFGLMSGNISLPKWLIDFGAKFEQARNSLKKMDVDFLNAKYEYDGSNDYIHLPNKGKIKLSQASSGLQSVIPLLLVVQFNTSKRNKKRDLFVIEEPELNLYPTSQKDLIEFIVARLNKSADKLIITTHSPYLLTTIDNLIQAQNVASQSQNEFESVNRLVSEEYWIKYDNVSCYYFDQGTGRSTMDEETKSIGPSNIDNVSERLSTIFEQLLALKYAE